MIFVKVIGLFIVIIPAFLYGLRILLGGTGSISILLSGLIKISFAVGTLTVVVFLVLMIAEQVQDYYFDKQYQKQRSKKVLLPNGNYECQYCGSQKVTEHDKICQVCGREFRKT